MGEVILGMPGQWAHDYREMADHYTSKIGGLPDWPDLDAAIKEELLMCGVCGGKIFLVAQIYAPVSRAIRSTDERVIYVLGCIKRECGSNLQSWKVLRVQKCKQNIQTKDEPLKEGQQEEKSSSVVQDPKSKDCPLADCGDEESDTDSDIDLDELAQALEQTTILASHSEKNKGTKHPKKIAKGPVAKKMIYDSTAPVLPCFYIYSEKGSSKGKACKSISDECSLLKEVEKNSQINEGEGEESWEGEEYEHDKALGADRTYLKFKKQLDESPKQCFRYSYGGNPLFPVANVPKPGKCNICGAKRRFELQLMPPLLYFLHEGSESSSDISLDGWTWLTIVIYTCPKSCSRTTSEEAGSSCWDIVEEEAILINDD